MKRILTFLLVLGLSFGLLIGCSNDDTDSSTDEVETDDQTESAEDTEASDFPVSLTDFSDNEITLEEEPERIVSLMPSNTEIVFALGAGEKVVGVNDFDTYPEEVLEIDKVGGMDLNIEEIISLKPDLVLAHGSSGEAANEGLDQIRNADIPVFVVIDAQSIDTTYESIDQIATLTGTTSEGTEVVDEMKDGFAELEATTADVAEADRKSVFMEVSPDPEIFTGGDNTFFQELLTLINADNAAEEHDGWLMLDPEVIIELNPDIILTTYGDYIDDPSEQVLSRDGWDEVNAVKDEKVFDLDADLVSRPGPRLVEGAKEIAEFVYPELYK